MSQPLPLLHIHCPVLILTADQDVLVPKANAERLARDLPNARLVQLTGVDHMFFLERAEETARVISEFFA
ncbi:MAG: alpha/beta hydrolase [Magnetococcales bacterium]|nr:alpha/beta hydrolase [Magnetococcales bacterium]